MLRAVAGDAEDMSAAARGVAPMRGVVPGRRPDGRRRRKPAAGGFFGVAPPAPDFRGAAAAPAAVEAFGRQLAAARAFVTGADARRGAARVGRARVRRWRDPSRGCYNVGTSMRAPTGMRS